MNKGTEKDRRNNNTALGTILTLTGASLWGLCGVAGKFVMGTKGVDPMWMVTLRLILAGTILLIFALVQNKGRGLFEIWKDRNSVLRLLAVAVFAFAVCQVTYFAAINYANAGVVTAIQQTSPVFVMLWVLYSERRGPRKLELTILCMVIIGAFLLATGGDISALVIPAIALIFAIISSITAAMYTLLPGKLIVRYGTGYAVGWGMLLAGLMMAPIIRLWNVSGTWDMGTVLGFGFVVIFGTVTAFGSFLYGVTIVGPERGSIYGLVEPVVAVIASAILLGQAFTITDIAGIVIIIVAVAVLATFRE